MIEGACAQASADARDGGNRAWLRSATRGEHEQVDASFAGHDAADPAGYCRMLAAHGVAVPMCEEWLARSGIARLLCDWPQRRRADALAHDLAMLGLPPAAPSALPAPLTPAGAIGLAYVLEGSRLGAALIHRRLATNPCANCRASDRFLRHGQGQRLWPNFVAALDAAPLGAARRKEALAGARAGFAVFLAAVATLEARAS